jgi:hypothetical protein
MYLCSLRKDDDDDITHLPLQAIKKILTRLKFDRIIHVCKDESITQDRDLNRIVLLNLNLYYPNKTVRAKHLWHRKSAIGTQALGVLTGIPFINIFPKIPVSPISRRQIPFLRKMNH